ncbi:hypothetical protein TrST_g9565 [Triparma strigata]|uniref:Dynamin-type G domain-containing protein n=1 Tax=Triparma strigata TaxID=1606541 RepID=A0A9W7EZF1_9STRA|nr:hypothetical protein TrST_g9565 [Triparma strigata]
MSSPQSLPPASPSTSPTTSPSPTSKKSPQKPSSTPSSTRDPVSSRVITGLKNLYHLHLSPIESSHHFSSFHYAPYSDSEIEAKPQVLLVGQYSTGKTTFISYLLGKKYPSAHIGPEPTTDKFIAVVHGPSDKVIKGNSLTVVPELPFGGLSTFGAGFLNKFEASVTSSTLLESVTLIDSPGVLSGEKQRVNRSYDFATVVKWFAERSDLILLLFDAHKLDVSDEFRDVIENLKPHDDKVRCVLNKADQISKSQFVRVYGSLLWSMGKIFRTPEVSRVYCGSYWEKDLVVKDYKDMFEEDEKLLLEELKGLPSQAAARKINDMVKRIRLVKVHVCILTYLKSKMPYFFGHEARQKQLLEDLEDVFEEVKIMYDLSDGDMPDITQFRVNLRSHDFRRFPKLDRGVLFRLDGLIQKEIPELMGRVGGVSGVLSMSKMGEVEHEDTKTRIKRKQEEMMRKRKSQSNIVGGVLIGVAVLIVLLLVLVGVVMGLEHQGVLKTEFTKAIGALFGVVVGVKDAQDAQVAGGEL